MSPQPPPEEVDPERARVAAVLAGLRAGVRQRQAELATVGVAADGARLALAELRGLEVLQEPVAASPRPVLGRWLGLARRVFFHAFGKWYARPLVRQQNELNRVVTRVLEDLIAAHERLVAETVNLRQRLERLEHGPGAGAGGEPRVGAGR